MVVSYNSRSILGPCLEALLDQDHPDLEVIVVDNASQDGTADFVAERYPQVRLIRSPKNTGFAGGNNLAFRSTEARHVVMVNQDALPRRNMVRELVRVAEWDPDTGAVGAKMLMARCPTLINSTGLEMNEGGWAWDRGVGERDVSSDPYPERVLSGCGGALLLSKAALARVGDLDEEYFMYFEDTDLGLRMALAGFHNHYAPLATCRHDYHGDALEDPAKDYRRRYLSERNRWQTLVKNWSWRTLRELYPRIRAHELGRAASLRKMVAEGNNAELAASVLEITRRARRWNLLHAPGLLWRRWRTQRVRRVPDVEVRKLLVSGVVEGGHQGDVESFHDRFSAVPRDAIVMGDTDSGAIGSGWHPVERPEGAPRAWRWCKRTAWFYLQPEAHHRALVAQLYSPTEPHAWTITAETTVLGSDTADNQGRGFRMELPGDLPRGGILEFRLDTEFLVPAERGIGEDRRELGLVVFGLQLK